MPKKHHGVPKKKAGATAFEQPLVDLDSPASTGNLSSVPGSSPIPHLDLDQMREYHEVEQERPPSQTERHDGAWAVGVSNEDHATRFGVVDDVDHMDEHDPERTVRPEERLLSHHESDQADYEDEGGHTRSPMLAPSRPSHGSLSRTITAALPSPPRVSRPISLGSFLPPSSSISSPLFSGSSAGSSPMSVVPVSATATEPIPPLASQSSHCVQVTDRDTPAPDTYSSGFVRRRGSDSVHPDEVHDRTISGLPYRSANSSNPPQDHLAARTMQHPVSRSPTRDVSIPMSGHVTSFPEPVLAPLLKSFHQDSAPTAYAHADTTQLDRVVWAKWDSLLVSGLTKRILVLGYARGLQIWDCTDLSSVSELLNLNHDSDSSMPCDIQVDAAASHQRRDDRDSSNHTRTSRSTGLGRPLFAASLPYPRSKRTDVFSSDRPLLGVVSLPAHGGVAELNVYSLRKHAVVHRHALPGLICFQASSELIVLSTVSPPTLQVLDACTFRRLHVIPSSMLTLFVHPPPLASSHNTTPFATRPHHTYNANLDKLTSPAMSFDSYLSRPAPVFALSGRLLAYASSETSLEKSTAPRSRKSITGLATSAVPAVGLSLAALDLGKVTQADIRHAASKAGSAVFNGVRSLGGMAYNTIQARTPGKDAVSDATSHEIGKDSARDIGIAALGRIFSRSAPAAAPTTPAQLMADRGSQDFDDADQRPDVAKSTMDGYVAVIDLHPLYAQQPTEPRLVARFVGSHRQAVCNLAFSSDGTSLAAAPMDGTYIKVFAIRPFPRHLQRRSLRQDVGGSLTDSISHTAVNPAVSQVSYTAIDDIVDFTTPAWHVYDLKRGRTSGIVQHMEWSNDGRWIAVSTRARTIHVFAVNPYGGKSDERSHMEGRVRNATEPQALLTEVSPLVRLRVSKIHANDVSHGALSFVFLSAPTSHALPYHLLPPPTSYPSPKSPPSLNSSPQQPPVSPTYRPRRATNIQDLLVFDPYDGALSLRRTTVELRMDRGVSVPSLSSISSSLPIPGISMSLPSSMGRLSSWQSGSPGSGLTGPKMAEEVESTELVGKDGTIATWNLKRGFDWKEVRRNMRMKHGAPEHRSLRKSNWLSEAELSTTSVAPRILPRSLYLSHQFSFYALGEDYHALVRRHVLDVPASRLSVRRSVAASAYTQGSAEPNTFGGPSPGSPFDEPIASAIGAGLDHRGSIQPALPMYPNGPARATTGIPIGRVAAGFGEGVGRLRREIGKVRSPRTRAQQEAGRADDVPLEFDEDDDDFTSIRHHLGGLIVSDDIAEDQAWSGWDVEDHPVVEEAEKFDDLVVGFMDEEQGPLTSAQRRPGVVARKKR